MIRFLLAGASLLAALSACAAPGVERAGTATPTRVKIIAFNDFHGSLEPPKQAIEAARAGEPSNRVPAGGAAYFASAIRALKAENPNHAVVSAGDMIGASPLTSSLFLDEPTIIAMNMIGIDFNAVGNHEFDRGRAELLRMKNGGCERHTPFQPCRMEPFPGADFGFLAANTRTEDGSTLFPPYAIKTFGEGASQVRVGFIGMTLKRTSALVTPAGIAGLTFTDEAETANALIPRLRQQGVEAIVVVIHQGLETDSSYADTQCNWLAGELQPVLDRLDPEVDVVVSGHTHRAYVCDYGQADPSRPFLLTSAGTKGTLLTSIDLAIDPATGEVTAKQAANVIVQSEGYVGPRGEVTLNPGFRRFEPDPGVAALVARYAEATKPLTRRVVGHLTAPAVRSDAPAHEQALGNLIADAQLEATRAPDKGGAQLAFMNPGGVRADLVPGPEGAINFGQIFTAQPFGNSLVVKSFTGRQIRGILEQQFNSGSNTVTVPYVLLVSSNFRYGFDLSRPAGQRIIDPRLDGKPLRDDQTYRVAINSFLSSGGDNFTLFREGTDEVGGMQDVDALEAYIAARSPLTPPGLGRVANLTGR